MLLFDPAKLGRVSVEAHQDVAAIEPATPATLEAFLAGIDTRAFRFAEIALRNREMTARLTWKPYMFNPRLPHFLPRVTAPTLLLWGREDGIVPVICGEQYRRLLPNATLRVLERCGHLPLIERPDEFAGLVLDFLRRA